MANRYSKIDAEDLVKDFMQSLEGTELKKRAEEEGVFNFKKIKEIVYTPFRALREDLDNGRLAVHRRLYFGTFYCTVKKAKYFLKVAKNGYDKGNMTEKRFKEVTRILNDFIKRKEV